LTDSEERDLGTNATNPDTDGDGLADGDEPDRGTDPTTEDTDGDGLADGREVDLGTDPTSEDSDGDGLDDGQERAGATNATVADTDADGLADGRERELGTDATLSDTDDDGLHDGDEVDRGSDPTSADSDEDAIEDGREVELGLDPTAADSDGDGLADGRELELGTNATRADTDDDGLDDGTELDLGSDPQVSDTDDDGLPDGQERDLGTNLTVADTDGDRLTDGAEVAGVTDGGVALPEADPLRMDLYVQINVSENAEPFDEGELDDLQDAWAEMPVENPDGSTGVDVHVDQGGLNESITISDDSDYVDLRDRSGEFLGNRSEVYYSVALVEVDDNYAGRAPSPGRISVVATQYTTRFDGTTYRTFVTVHELLHNVAGRLDEANRCPGEFDGEPADYHTCDGWLSYDDPATSQFLPDGVAAELERDGFLRGSHRD